MGSTLQVRLPVPLTTDTVDRLCSGLREQLAAGTVAAVVCHVDGAVGDLSTVDAIARLALVTRRAGVPFSLDSPGADLSSLLSLVGLRAALARPVQGPGAGVRPTGPAPPCRAGADPGLRRSRHRGGAAGQ